MIKGILNEHKIILNTLESDWFFFYQIENIVDEIVKCFKANHKLILFGCGGSAADSQHIAAEFVNKFGFEREALPAIALTTDTSNITAIGNDRGFERIYQRQIEAIANKNDVVIGISTSGQSNVVLYGLTKAKMKGCKTILLEGNSNETLPSFDIRLKIPSSSTPRIQEFHILVLHMISQLVESRYCEKLQTSSF